MLGKATAKRYVGDLLDPSRENPDLKADLFHLKITESEHSLLSLLMSDFASRFHDRFIAGVAAEVDEAAKQSEIDIFCQAASFCIERGATLQHSAFIASPVIPHLHPLISIMVLEKKMTQDQAKQITSALTPLFAAAPYSVLDGGLENDIAHSPWLAALAHRLEHWVELMRPSMLFASPVMKIDLTPLLEGLQTAIAEHPKPSHNLMSLLASLPMISSVIGVFLEFFERHHADLRVVYIAGPIVHQWLEKVRELAKKIPTSVSSTSMCNRIDRLCRLIPLSQNHLNVGWGPSSVLTYQKILSGHQIPPSKTLAAFASETAKLSPLELTIAFYEPLRLFSALDPRFSSFNPRKIRVLLPYFSAVIENPRLDLVGGYNKKDYYLATRFALHAGLVALLERWVDQLFKRKGVPHEKLQGAVNRAFEVACQHNNMSALKLLFQNKQTEALLSTDKVLDQLKTILNEHAYCLDTLFILLKVISQRDIALFKSIVHSAPFDDETFLNSYVQIACQHLFDWDAPSDFAQTPAAYVNWHVGHALILIDHIQLKRMWKQIKEAYGNDARMPERAFANMLLHFCQHPLWAQEPVYLVAKANFLVDIKAPFALDESDFDLCDRILKTGEVLPSEQVQVDELTRFMLPIVQEARLKHAHHLMAGLKEGKQALRKGNTQHKKTITAMKKTILGLNAQISDLTKTVNQLTLKSAFDGMLADFNRFESGVFKITHTACAALSRSAVKLSQYQKTALKRAGTPSVEASSTTASSGHSPIPAEVEVPMLSAATQVRQRSGTRARLRNERDALRGLVQTQQMQLRFLLQNSMPDVWFIEQKALPERYASEENRLLSNQLKAAQENLHKIQAAFHQANRQCESMTHAYHMLGSQHVQLQHSHNALMERNAYLEAECHRLSSTLYEKVHASERGALQLPFRVDAKRGGARHRKRKEKPSLLDA